MAQYAPYIQETVPEMPLYKPDFNFFDKMLQRKEDMFEQGLYKAQNAYASVLNAPLSNKDNIPLRDQYMKNADEQLKKLSSADLSLPQNVAEAENIYAPFWKDPFIVKDAELTKWYQNQAQIAMARRDSPDEKTRELYNPVVMQYLNNGLEKLQNAERTSESFGKIEKRSAVPFTNIQKYLEDAAVKDKKEIKWDERNPDGGYLIENINGERSKVNFAIWAQSMIGNNFDAQFNVQGTVEHEESIKQLKQRFPNITDQQAVELLGDDVINKLDRGYKKRQGNINGEKARITAMLGELSKQPVLSQEQQAAVLGLNNDLVKLNGDDAKLNSEYSNFNTKEKLGIKEDFVTNPTLYYTKLAKQRTVDNWATGKSVIQSQKTTKDDTWFAAQDLFLKQKDQTLKERKQEWDEKKDQWEMTYGKPPGTKTGPDDKPVAEVIPVEGNVLAGFYVGLGTTDVTGDAVTAQMVYDNKMNTTFYSAHNLIYDIKGPLRFLKQKGITDEELIAVSSALKKDIQNPEYTFTPEEGKASNKITNLLLADDAVKAAGIKDVTGPTSLRNAIMAYTKGYVENKSKAEKDGVLFFNKEEIEAIAERYNTAKSMLEFYTLNQEKRQQLIKDNILTNKKEYSNLITVKDGKEDLISVDDLAKEMPTLELYDKIDKKNIKLTKQDVAKAFMNGQLSQTQGGGTEFMLGDKSYSLTKINNKEANPLMLGFDFLSRSWNNLYNDVILPKYGTSKNFSEKFKKAEQSIIPNLPFYSSQTGKVGAEFNYQIDPSSKVLSQDDKAYRILRAASSTANAEFYDDKGVALPAEDIEKIQGLIQEDKNNVPQFTYATQGVKGLPTIRFKLISKPTETKGADLSTVTARTINLAILPGSTNNDLNQLPSNEGMYVHDYLLRGKPYKSDPILKAAGWDLEILPTNTKDPDEVMVNLTYKKRIITKDETGKLILSTKTEKLPTDYFRLKGPGAKNPDELINSFSNLFADNMRENERITEQYNLYLQNTPTANGVNTQDFYKKNNIKID
jgi:hypothetical protein